MRGAARRRTCRRSGPRTAPSSSSRPTGARRARSSLSQATPGRKNRLWFSFDGPDASYAFDQERPDELWVGGRALTAVVARAAEGTAAAAGAYSRLPAGHPQGYQDAFDAYVSDVYGAVAGDLPEGLPSFADGLRAAVLTEAVVRSAASGGWVEVAP